MPEPVTKISPSNAVTVKNDSRRSSPAVLFAWGLSAFAVAVAVWSIADLLPHLIGTASPIQVLSEVLLRFFIVVFAVPAALIIARQPRNTIGWLLVIPVLGGCLAWFSEAYFRQFAVAPATPSPFLFVALFIDDVNWTLFIFPILVLPLFFPTGRPPSRRWNWVVAYAIIWPLIFFVVAALSQQVGPSTEAWKIPNPIGLLPNDIIDSVFSLPWVFGMLLLAVICLTALVVRYRRGSSLEKAQIKWVVYASVFFAVGYLIFLPLNNGPSQFLIDLTSLLLPLILFAIPLSIGIAILHYRLWDIDFVINRSLVYGALTVLLLTLFGLSLWIVHLLFESFAGGPVVAVVVAAAAFGALFQPIRRRLQRFVDRRFYNIQIDYNKTPVPLPVSPTNIFKHTHFGDYQNLELIGQGGMAEVYKSIHPTLGTPVAIKILPASLANDSDFQRRFVREAQTVAKLHHPNIIRVFDHGQLDGQHYMVMEYIAGKDLGDYLTRHGRLTLAQALPLFRGLASALDYAHTQGLVHRDIKPSNLLLDQAASAPNASPADYRAVLTDFGIAKILSGVTRYTATGSMVGTLDYIAPEQIQGATDVDGRADVYASGILVYQTLTGQLPFQHQNPGALIMAHLMQPPPDPRLLVPDFSPEAAYVIQRALAKRPEDRFVTVGEFINALANSQS